MLLEFFFFLQKKKKVFFLDKGKNEHWLAIELSFQIDGDTKFFFQFFFVIITSRIRKNMARVFLELEEKLYPYFRIKDKFEVFLG